MRSVELDVVVESRTPLSGVQISLVVGNVGVVVVVVVVVVDGEVGVDPPPPPHDAAGRNSFRYEKVLAAGAAHARAAARILSRARGGVLGLRFSVDHDAGARHCVSKSAGRNIHRRHSRERVGQAAHAALDIAPDAAGAAGLAHHMVQQDVGAPRRRGRDEGPDDRVGCQRRPQRLALEPPLQNPPKLVVQSY